MNRFDKLALTAAILATLLFARHAISAASLYLAHASPATVAGRIAGELIVTYGPIAVAALFWRWSKRTSMPWLPHLLFLPVALLVLWAGAALLLTLAEASNFDDTIGGPVVAAFLLFLIAIGIYCAALLSSPRGPRPTGERGA
ncbi:hypothetical protein ACQKOH_01630 [Sphingomonas sp. NPDC092331]|jgi:hypothetical protein|uniref:hypothetical protein n=1 Tax=unclassified Sphingomonas TaxID=196159 RepID=UPI0029ECCEDD|nr:hypothetical protein [Pseudomonadota bacterium]